MLLNEEVSSVTQVTQCNSMYKAKSKKADSVLKYKGISIQGTLALGTKAASAF